MTQASGLMEAIGELQALLGSRLETSTAVRESHGHDESWHEGALPDAVAFVASTEEVAGVVRICAKHKVPVIPFGAGTSLEGHVAAVEGGIAIDMGGMDKVVRVSQDDLDCTVQAGIRRKALNENLRDTGLFFPVDPGADATIGGMVATRASGTNAVRYGTIRENVLGLTVVLADGSIVHTGGRARKSAAGYDLTHLMIGSEGTLGVVTEVTLRLHGIPEEMGAAICTFDSVDGAVRTVIETIQMGVPIARIEILDDAMVAACNAYSKLDLPVKPLLFMGFQGSSSAMAEQSATVQEIAQANGGSGFEWSMKPEEISRLSTARHNAYYAAVASAPGKKGFTTDVCVPISALAQCISETRVDLEASHIHAPLVGHVGDGNFHLIMLVDPDNAAEVDAAKAFHGRLVERALSLGGTCTGEHGIGQGKVEFLEREHGDLIPLMRAIKQALDPQGIMNPGKMLPSA